METEKIVDPKTGLNDYIELSEKRTWLAIQNWRTVEEPNKKNPAEKPFIKFKADVWKYGDSPSLLNICADKHKSFETTHVDLRRRLNDILQHRKASELILVGIKIVDATKKPINYDVEVA